MGAMNFPTTIKMFGVHLVPTPTEAGLGSAAWTQLFLDWDWTGWVKKQIDYAVGNRIGANCIGLVGCMDGVHAATITQTTVNSRWTQLAAYLAGFTPPVYLYIKPCAFNQMTGVTNTECSTYIASILNALSIYNNVIGCDIVLEADTWNDGAGTMTAAIATRLNTIYTSVKSGSSIPCTFSLATNWTNAAMRTWAGTLTPDYWDFHPYAMNSWASPLVLSDMNYWFTNFPSNDIVFGEGGSPQSDSVDTQNTFLRGVANLMNQGDTRLRGWLMWAAQDQDTVAGNEWGLHDASWNQRQNKANVLRQFTGGSLARANHTALGS